MKAVDEPRPPVKRRVSFTRTRGTSVAFSWRVRVALSALPLLPLEVLRWGGLAFTNPITWPFLVLIAFGAAVWWPHVWINTPVASGPARTDDASDDPSHSVDLFTWPQPHDALPLVDPHEPAAE